MTTGQGLEILASSVSCEMLCLASPLQCHFGREIDTKKQVQKALNILKKMEAIKDDNIKVTLGSDEASCSQLTFLYGEALKFPGKPDRFMKLLSSSRADDKIRIASLDIGGGTTDLMISDYSSVNPNIPQDTNIQQELIYSDGVNKAGDDILKEIIYEVVIPNLRTGLSLPNKGIAHQSF